MHLLLRPLMPHRTRRVGVHLIIRRSLLHTRLRAPMRRAGVHLIIRRLLLHIRLRAPMRRAGVHLIIRRLRAPMRLAGPLHFRLLSRQAGLQRTAHHSPHRPRAPTHQVGLRHFTHHLRLSRRAGPRLFPRPLLHMRRASLLHSLRARLSQLQQHHHNPAF